MRKIIAKIASISFKIASFLLLLLIYGLLVFPEQSAKEENKILYNYVTKEVYMNGKIDHFTYKKLDRIGFDNIKKITINSVGGELLPAARIVQELLSRDIETYVPKNGHCFSACVLIFQAGNKRYAHSTAVFMVHNAMKRNALLNTYEISEEATISYYRLLSSLGAADDLLLVKSKYDQVYIDAKVAQTFNIVQIIETK